MDAANIPIFIDGTHKLMVFKGSHGLDGTLFAIFNYCLHVTTSFFLSGHTFFFLFLFLLPTPSFAISFTPFHPGTRKRSMPFCSLKQFSQ
jgi:hypothetical protein